ncbi:MAG: SDR family oxidoreductase [Actinomycetota bacterium]|nr:SDR family oxidoreductase [Actinomycetota bacterium]
MDGPRYHPSFRLDGRVAVVVGGTGTLGSSMAGALAGAGAATVVVGRDRERGEEVAGRLAPAAEAGGGSVHAESCDATSRSGLRDLVGRVLDAHGRVDVLVNGAGANSATPFLEIGDEELERLVAVDQLAVARSCQEFGRYLVDRARASGEGASIVNVGSVSGRTPLSRVFTYSMAKAAVHNLTANLAREWGPLGIRCNVLVPGFFPAGQNRSVLTPDRSAAVVAHTPMGRFGEPADLSGALLLLASDAGRFITGAELVVDGGFSATAV